MIAAVLTFVFCVVVTIVFSLSKKNNQILKFVKFWNI